MVSPEATVTTWAMALPPLPRKRFAPGKIGRRRNSVNGAVLFSMWFSEGGGALPVVGRFQVRAKAPLLMERSSKTPAASQG
jgi:hypothetical protein